MAIIQIRQIETDTRWAKEIRLFGLSIYIVRKLNLESSREPNRIGFQQIGDTSLSEVDE